MKNLICSINQYINVMINTMFKHLVKFLYIYAHCIFHNSSWNTSNWRSSYLKNLLEKIPKIWTTRKKRFTFPKIFESRSSNNKINLIRQTTRNHATPRYAFTRKWLNPSSKMECSNLNTEHSSSTEYTFRVNTSTRFPSSYFSNQFAQIGKDDLYITGPTPVIIDRSRKFEVQGRSVTLF